MTVLAAAAALLATGCLLPIDRCDDLAAGSAICPMPGWGDRAFDVTVPPGWDGTTALPLVLALHGGGGNRRSAARVTCPDGDEADPGCLTGVAQREGFIVVYPDGTGSRPIRNLRTWNAGGGRDGWNCTSGPACRSGVDDVAYFRALLDEVERIVPVDTARVYATGLSNGAAMSHRLACELPDEIAAIAAVGGTNQFTALEACDSQVPILQIHGTDDPCWSYDETDDTCLPLTGDAGVKVGVDQSMEGWRTRNGCGADPVEEALPDTDPDDGIRAVRVTWQDCARPVQLIRLDGGGHTWPGGWGYFGRDRIGRVGRDFNGSETIWEFLRAQSR